MKRTSLRWTALVGAAAVIFGRGCLSAPSSSSGDTPVPRVGCAIASPPPHTPGGYYTSGATVCADDGTTHLFHGVDRSSLEFDSAGVDISQSDFDLMAGWGANVVRIALNQDFWLSAAALYDPTYQGTVEQAVTWAENAGLDVILDLHWSDAGDLSVTATSAQGPGNSNQQTMADQNSVEFWKEVATVFKDDPHVLFELYNEPHGISWDVWLNGGPAGSFTAAGMQTLYGTVRATGANNVVVAGGLAYAFDLSEVGPGGYSIDGYNVMYATHPYETSGGDAPAGWQMSFGHLATTDFAPVIATEFGDPRPQCTGQWDEELIDFMDPLQESWTAWAWYVGDPCAFPSLISDWTGTPTVQGAVVKMHLQGYPASEGPRPFEGQEAGADGAEVFGDGASARDARSSVDATSSDATSASDSAPADGVAPEASGEVESGLSDAPPSTPSADASSADAAVTEDAGAAGEGDDAASGDDDAAEGDDSDAGAYASDLDAAADAADE